MIYLMRHGQDDERFIGGWSNAHLTEQGIIDTIETAKWIKENLNISNIICSDILRAQETAEIVNNYLEVPIVFDSNLREQNKGLLNGMEGNVAKYNYQELLSELSINTIYPEGESLNDLFNRIKNYLDVITKFNNNTLVITHRGVINVIYYLYFNKELDMNKGQFNVNPSSVHELDVINRLIRKVR